MARRSRREGDKSMAQRRIRHRELEQMAREPFLEAEKKLVGWSLASGVILLALLVWLSYTFFPAH